MALGTAAAAATIVSAVIGGGGVAVHQIHKERTFDKLIRDMNRAARKNKNVVKSRGGFWFFHAEDWEGAGKTSDGPTGYLKSDAKRQRVTRLTPRDGWVWNDWELKYWDKSKRDSGRTEHISTAECSQMFHKRFIYGSLASNGGARSIYRSSA